MNLINIKLYHFEEIWIKSWCNSPIFSNNQKWSEFEWFCICRKHHGEQSSKSVNHHGFSPSNRSDLVDIRETVVDKKVLQNRMKFGFHPETINICSNLRKQAFYPTILIKIFNNSILWNKLIEFRYQLN